MFTWKDIRGLSKRGRPGPVLDGEVEGQLPNQRVLREHTTKVCLAGCHCTTGVKLIAENLCVSRSVFGVTNVFITPYFGSTQEARVVHEASGGKAMHARRKAGSEGLMQSKRTGMLLEKGPEGHHVWALGFFSHGSFLLWEMLATQAIPWQYHILYTL